MRTLRITKLQGNSGAESRELPGCEHSMCWEGRMPILGAGLVSLHLPALICILYSKTEIAGGVLP
jgi:hypothetical protein